MKQTTAPQPLLYESGWGKRPALVAAVGVTGAADVTARYAADLAEAVRRRRDDGDLSLLTDEIIAAQARIVFCRVVG
jgi:hypothetical protein